MKSRKSSLQDELLKEFDSEAEQIRERGAQQAEAILDDARAEREARLREGREEIEREIAARRTRALSKARLERRNAILQAEQDLVDGIFENALKRFVEMADNDPSRYAELLETFFAAGRKLLPGRKIRLLPGAGAETFLRRVGDKKEIEVEEAADFYGMILETLDSRVRCDYRLESIMRSMKASRQAEIREILFEDRK